MKEEILFDKQDGTEKECEQIIEVLKKMNDEPSDFIHWKTSLI